MKTSLGDCEYSNGIEFGSEQRRVLLGTEGSFELACSWR